VATQSDGGKSKQKFKVSRRFDADYVIFQDEIIPDLADPG
jgi:hypothetical protein